MELRLGHISLQFSDTNLEQTRDIEKLFAYARAEKLAWIAGTEAGPGSGNTASELIRVAKLSGYRPWVPSAQPRGSEGRSTDCWIAVREDLIEGGWAVGYIPAIPGSAALYAEQGLSNPSGKHPKWAPKGLVHVSFDNEKLGRINVGAAHYLTGGRRPNARPVLGVDHWAWNKKLAEVIGDWAKRVGSGPGLAFYSGDQNMNDARNDQPQGDTFHGQPLTSAWDELKVYEKTRERSTIDVIASYDGDRRVTARKIVALDDREFRLNTDHHLIVASYEIKEFRVDPTPVEHACSACGLIHSGILV